MRSTAIGFTEQNGLEKVVDGVPIGAIIPYAGSTAPFGTLICNGAAISRSAYPELFEAIGTTWGAGDGSTTFNIPDLRGYFLRGVGGRSAGLAAEQGDAIRNFISSFDIRGWTSNDTVNAQIGTLITANGGGWIYEGTGTNGSVPTAGNGNFNDVPNSRIVFDPSRAVPTANENRPINKAVNYIIVYE